MTKLEMLEQEKEELKNMQECLGYLQVFVERDYFDVGAHQLFIEKYKTLSDDAKVKVVELISKELQKSVVNVDEVIKTK